MRTLLLLRHAKSSWEDPELSDHDRPLAPRGIRAARRIAQHLISKGVRPELVLCSSARRARETLDLVQPAVGHDVAVQIEDGLYGADTRDLGDRLRRVDASVNSVMLVGHNPGLQDLAIELADGGDRESLAQLRAKFPTAALARLNLEITGWDQIGPKQAQLVSLVLPRQLD